MMGTPLSIRFAHRITAWRTAGARARQAHRGRVTNSAKLPPASSTWDGGVHNGRSKSAALLK